MLAVKFENNAGAFELAAGGGLGVERFPALCGCTVFGKCKLTGCGLETDMASFPLHVQTQKRTGRLSRLTACNRATSARCWACSMFNPALAG